MLDFVTWLQEHQEHIQESASTPKSGDIIITAPATFFRGPASRVFYKKGATGTRPSPNPRINPWFIDGPPQQGMEGDLEGKSYYNAVYVLNPARKMKFAVEDINYNVTNAYPSHERYGRNVWLYIPESMPQLRVAYEKWAARSQEPEQPMVQPPMTQPPTLPTSNESLLRFRGRMLLGEATRYYDYC